tara:strand:+ start:381 stop:494 length:114 start_codon:yes stop_codon:yes gene_type:complete
MVIIEGTTALVNLLFVVCVKKMFIVIVDLVQKTVKDV